jgi:hypothetical protein
MPADSGACFVFSKEDLPDCSGEQAPKASTRAISRAIQSGTVSAGWSLCSR